jgi:hypothetical protein
MIARSPSDSTGASGSTMSAKLSGPASPMGFRGVPIYVEHEHFSVIDHGGDGLSIYEFDAPDLRFRLWESKPDDSPSTSVTIVVTGAAGQQKRTRPHISREFRSRSNCTPIFASANSRAKSCHSTTRDASGGVGVSVGTTNTMGLPSRPSKHCATHSSSYRGLSIARD